eukprot:6882734-Pyramimonas_sp.AAC.1
MGRDSRLNSHCLRPLVHTAPSLTAPSLHRRGIPGLPTGVRVGGVGGSRRIADAARCGAGILRPDCA